MDILTKNNLAVNKKYGLQKSHGAAMMLMSIILVIKNDCYHEPQ